MEKRWGGRLEGVGGAKRGSECSSCSVGMRIKRFGLIFGTRMSKKARTFAWPETGEEFAGNNFRSFLFFSLSLLRGNINSETKRITTTTTTTTMIMIMIIMWIVSRLEKRRAGVSVRVRENPSGLIIIIL